MKIVYSAPNRAHHYGYARELHRAGFLEAFVCGFSRLSRRAPLPEIGSALCRADQLQTLYVASLRLGLPRFVTDELAHWAKLQLDRAAREPLRQADAFLFYNGCGLGSARWFRARGGVTIVEAVNSHVAVQEMLLEEEHSRLSLPWQRFHPREKRRRITEIEEADFVLVPSTFVARSFREMGFPSARLLRLPYPMQRIGDGSAPQKAERADDTFRVLFVGTVSVRKGVRYLIEAFRQLNHPRKELWIVGPTARPSGLENVAWPEQVRFFGPLKGAALQNAYQSATVFCLPSIEEGLALVLSEALSLGLPVIATTNTGVEDLPGGGGGAMVVPIRDPAAITAQLQQLADDPRFLEMKRRAAVEWAASQAGGATATVSLSEMLHAAVQGLRDGKSPGRSDRTLDPEAILTLKTSRPAPGT